MRYLGVVGAVTGSGQQPTPSPFGDVSGQDLRARIVVGQSEHCHRGRLAQHRLGVGREGGGRGRPGHPRTVGDLDDRAGRFPDAPRRTDRSGSATAWWYAAVAALAESLR